MKLILCLLKKYHFLSVQVSHGSHGRAFEQVGSSYLFSAERCRRLVKFYRFHPSTQGNEQFLIKLQSNIDTLKWYISWSLGAANCMGGCAGQGV